MNPVTVLFGLLEDESPVQFSDALGAVTLETDVDKAVAQCLYRWLPPYLATSEVERNLPIRTIPRPVKSSYDTVLESVSFPNQRLPTVLATTASVDEVLENADGSSVGTYSTSVTVIVRGRQPQEARYIAAIYGASVRRVLKHQPLDFYGYNQTVFRSGALGPVSDVSGSNRYLAASISDFHILADAIVESGPLLPSLEDGPYPAADPEGHPEVPYMGPIQGVESIDIDVLGLPIRGD